MLGGTADQQAALAAAQQPAAAGGCGGGAAAHAEGAAAAAEAEEGSLASVTAAIAKGSQGLEAQLLEHMTADQRRRLVKLQQEALAVGAELLGKDASALRASGDRGDS